MRLEELFKTPEGKIIKREYAKKEYNEELHLIDKKYISYKEQAIEKVADQQKEIQEKLNKKAKEKRLGEEIKDLAITETAKFGYKLLLERLIKKLFNEYYEKNIELADKIRQIDDENFTSKFSTKTLTTASTSFPELISILNYWDKLYPFPAALFYQNKFLIDFEFPNFINLDDFKNPEEDINTVLNNICIILSSTIRKITGFGGSKLEFQKVGDYSNLFSYNEFFSTVTKFIQSSSGDLVFRNPVEVSNLKGTSHINLKKSPYFFWKNYIESISDMSKSSFSTETTENNPPFPITALNASFVIRVFLFSDLMILNKDFGESAADSNKVKIKFTEVLDYTQSIKYSFHIIEFDILAVPIEVSGFSLDYASAKPIDYTVKVNYLFFDMNEYSVEYVYDRKISKITEISIPTIFKFFGYLPLVFLLGAVIVNAEKIFRAFRGIKFQPSDLLKII